MIRPKPKQGTRKAAFSKKRTKRITRAQFSWRLRRFVGLMVLAFLIAAGVAVFFSPRVQAPFQAYAIEASAKAGFVVGAITVEGRLHSEAAEILKALGAEEGQPLLAVPLESGKEALEKLPWIKTASVQRRWPDTIFVRLEEREPLALWQKDKELALIDSEGVVITRKNLGRFDTLMILTGENAPKHAASLIGLLKADPLIMAYIEAASWTGDRRWNLKTSHGTIIKLPEGDIGLALARLSKLQKEEGVFEKGIEQIDLRDPSRIIVRTAAGGAQTYEAGYEKTGDI